MQESAEDQIKKHALLEALFVTKLWSEPYLRENPFIYITPRRKDFEGEKGEQMKSILKNIFYKAYKKYAGIIEKVTNQEGAI